MKLPSTWKEVTIKQFVKITDVLKAPITEDFTEQDRIIHIVNIFLEEQRKDIMLLKGREVLQLFRQLSFVNEPIDETIKLSFTLKGQKYIVEERHQVMSTAQYLDFKHFTAGKTQDEIIDNLHNILAVMCLPAKRYLFGWKAKRYEGDSHVERANLFYNHLTIDIAYPLAVFFYNLSNALKDITLTSLEGHIGEIAKEMKQTHTSKNGERTSFSTRLQEEIQLRRKRFLNGVSRSS